MCGVLVVDVFKVHVVLTFKSLLKVKFSIVMFTLMYLFNKSRTSLHFFVCSCISIYTFAILNNSKLLNERSAKHVYTKFILKQ